MQIWKFAAGVLVFGLLSGASPSDSGYSSVPKKREAYGSKNELHQIREESVKPEEVFKNGEQEVAIIATDTGYFPSRIFVRKHIPVRLFLTSASSSTLCFVMDEFSTRKGIGPQQLEVVRFLPEKSGEYRFYCPVKEIQGTIVVRD